MGFRTNAQGQLIWVDEPYSIAGPTRQPYPRVSTPANPLTGDDTPSPVVSTAPVALPPAPGTAGDDMLPPGVRPPPVIDTRTNDDPEPYAHQGLIFGNLNNMQANTLNDPSNYTAGYQKLMDWANPNNSSSNYGNWLQGQAGETKNRYDYASTMDEDLKWLDYLEQQAPGMRDMFKSLSARSRGENPALYESGVYLG